MSWTPQDFKAKRTVGDADLGAAAAAAGTILAVTVDKSTPVAIAGIAAAGLVIAVAVWGRYTVRRGGVDAAGLAIASEAAATAGERSPEDFAADRDDELLALIAAGDSEQAGLGIPPSIAALEVDNGEGDGDLPPVESVDLG